MSGARARLRAIETERDRLAELFDRQVSELAAVAQTNGELAEARQTILRLRDEADELHARLAQADADREELEHGLRRTQEVARAYAGQLDALERRHGAGAWWRRLMSGLTPRPATTRIEGQQR